MPHSVRSSVRIQIHGLFGYLLLQFWSYSFNILQDLYTHNGGVHVHRLLIFFKYSQNDRQLDLSFCLSVRIQIHGLSRYLLLQFWSYSFNILYNVYAHNGGVHVHRILIFIKYLIMTGSWTGGGIICVLQTHFIFKRSLLTKQLHP